MKKVLTLLVVAALLPLTAVAQQQRSGKVTILEGTASLFPTAAATARPLKQDDPVSVNNVVKTERESLVKMFLGGKALVTVRELSTLTITEIPKGDAIDLTGDGKVRVALIKARLKPGDSYDIRTPNAIASVRGSAAIVELNGARTDIDNEQGDVRGGLRTTGPTIQIPPGQGLTIIGNVLGPLRPIRPDVNFKLQSKTKPGQGQKVTPSESDLASDLSGLGGGSGAAMPGASPYDSSQRVLPGNPKSGVYVP